MKLTKYILKFISISLIAVISCVPDYSFFKDNERLNICSRIVIILIMYIFVEVITGYLNQRYNPFSDLIEFMNSCLKKDIEICPLSQNTAESSENNMSKNDEIHILTNDLMNYDLKEFALTLIASNVINGVKYIYYIPNSQREDYKSFRERLCLEITRQLDKEAQSDEADNYFNSNVLFFFIPDENDLTYNFSLTLFSDPRKNTGCWYISENDITLYSAKESVQNLVIVRMNSYDDIKRLKSLFIKITKRYKFRLPKNSRLLK